MSYNVSLTSLDGGFDPSFDFTNMMNWQPNLHHDDETGSVENGSFTWNNETGYEYFKLNSSYNNSDGSGDYTFSISNTIYKDQDYVKSDLLRYM